MMQADSTMANAQLKTVLRYLRDLAGGPSDDALSDGRLLEQFVKEREESAFAKLLERHGPMVLGVCRRVLDEPHDAEDAFQATFLILMRKAGSLDGRRSLAGWLYTVAFHTSLKARARAQCRAKHETQAMKPRMHETAPSDAWQDLRPLLDGELERLPEKYRLPLVLCYLEGRTHEEAAEQLGWPLGTVKGRLSRARDLLRGRLVRRGVTLPSVLLGTVLAQHAQAAVPAELAAAALHAVMATAVVPASVMSLTTGVLHAMWITKLKWTFAAMLVLGLAVTGPFVAHALWQRGQVHGRAVDPNPDEAPVALQDKRPDLPVDAMPKGAVARLGSTRGRLGPYGAIAISRDGRILACARGNEVRLWDTATGQEVQVVRGQQGAMGPIALSADARILIAGGADKFVRVWNLATGKEERRLAEHPAAVSCVALSPDGTTIASAGVNPIDGAQSIFISDTASGKLLRQCNGHAGGIFSLAFAADGKVLASRSFDKTVRLWEVASAKEIKQWETSRSASSSMVSFSADGKLLATCGGDDSLVVWDIETGKEVPRFAGLGYCQSVAFSPDGKLLVSQSKGCTIHMLDVASGKEIRQVWRRGWASSWVFSGDGKLLALAEPGMLSVLDCTTGLFLPQFGGDQRWSFESLAMSPDGKTVASAGWDGPTLWDAGSGKRIRELDGKQARVTWVAWSPDGRLLASCGQGNKSICIWDMAGMKIQRRLEAPVGPFRATFSPDSTLLAWSEAEAIHLTEVAGGKNLRVLPTTMGDTAMSLAFSPNGKMLASAVTEGGLHLWEVGSGMMLRNLRGHQGDVNFVAFTADGKTLWSNGLDGQVRRWNADSGNQVDALAAKMQILAGSPSGKIVELGKDGQFRLWDLAATKGHGWHRPEIGRIMSASFSADGRFLVTGGSDGAALVWHVAELCK